MISRCLSVDTSHSTASKNTRKARSCRARLASVVASRDLANPTCSPQAIGKVVRSLTAVVCTGARCLQEFCGPCEARGGASGLRGRRRGARRCRRCTPHVSRGNLRCVTAGRIWVESSSPSLGRHTRMMIGLSDARTCFDDAFLIGGIPKQHVII